MKAEEFERKFDEAQEDLLEDLELSTARRVNLESKRINVDFPSWVVEALDREATRIGVTRQSIIKMWLVERLQLEASRPFGKGDHTSSGSEIELNCRTGCVEVNHQNQDSAASISAGDKIWRTNDSAKTSRS